MREGRGVDAHVDLPLSVAGFRLSLKSLDVVGILRATSVLISTMATGAPIRNWGIPPSECNDCCNYSVRLSALLCTMT